MVKWNFFSMSCDIKGIFISDLLLVEYASGTGLIYIYIYQNEGINSKSHTQKVNYD